MLCFYDQILLQEEAHEKKIDVIGLENAHMSKCASLLQRQTHIFPFHFLNRPSYDTCLLVQTQPTTNNNNKMSMTSKTTDRILIFGCRRLL